MALSMLVALTTCPALLAASEAIHQGQQKDRREAHHARRCNLIATCLKPSAWASEINHKAVVLDYGRLVVGPTAPEDLEPQQHLCTGYFLPYPHSNHECLVTSICEEPPIMKWIYVDKDSLEVRYGVRVDAQPHLTGLFDCTHQDRRLTLEAWEGFVAVQQQGGDVWRLYFDKDDNDLRDRLPQGTRVLEVELWRVEKRRKKGDHADGENLPKRLHEWLFPEGGPLRDFETLQVSLLLDDEFCAFDKDDKITNLRLPPQALHRQSAQDSLMIQGNDRSTDSHNQPRLLRRQTYTGSGGRPSASRRATSVTPVPLIRRLSMHMPAWRSSILIPGISPDSLASGPTVERKTGNSEKSAKLDHTGDSAYTEPHDSPPRASGSLLPTVAMSSRDRSAILVTSIYPMTEQLHQPVCSSGIRLQPRAIRIGAMSLLFSMPGYRLGDALSCGRG